MERRCSYRVGIEVMPRGRRKDAEGLMRICALAQATRRLGCMKSTTVSERAQAWVVDYSAARMQAIRWLGNRYLLARPINAKANAWRNPVAADLRAASAAIDTPAT